MTLLIATPGRDSGALAERLRALLPEHQVRLWPDIEDPGRITFALVWQPPRGLFAQLPNLRAVSSLGAGVDGLVDDPELPAEIPLGRLAGPRLAADMAGYLVATVIDHWRGLRRFDRDQRQALWRPRAPAGPPAIGVMGMGEMGAKCAAAFDLLGCPAQGWSRSGRGPDRIEMHSRRDGLDALAAGCDYLINLLPLTPATENILDARLFAQMKPGSTLVNVGRGAHLVEADLLTALDSGRPDFAILDVFRTEPLPPDHPFWRHRKIRITPHCASVTLPTEAAALAAESYRQVMNGQPPLGLVNRQRGY